MEKSFRICAGIAFALMPMWVIADSETFSPTTLAAPEAEMQLAMSRLENLQKTLLASQKIIKSQELGVQSLSAERAFNNAKAYFKAGEFLSVIRELNDYLNLTQIPNTDPYLEAQYMLARSYEQVGLDFRAVRAYLRYVATFLTMKNNSYKQLLEVMHRLMPLAAKKSVQDNSELRRLLSSIISLQLPEDQRAEIFYYAGNSAVNNGEEKLAHEWFKRAEAQSKDEALQARAVYFLALLALANEDYDEAQKYLEKITELKDQSSGELRELATLAKARIALRQRRSAIALELYKQIGEKSPHYRDALFESIYINLSLEKNEDARTLAKTFLQKFPDNKDAFQIKTLIGYLDLRAGALGDARKSIQAADEELASLSDWFSKNYTNKSKLSHMDVQSIVMHTNDQVPASPAISEGYKIFNAIAELNRQLADAQGNMRNLIFTMGRTTVSQFNPEWIRRNEQLQLLSKECLSIGHRLVSTYKILLNDRLQPLDKVSLTASEHRRMSLFNQAPTLKREKVRWGSWVNITTLNEDIAKRHAGILKARAELAASALLQAVKKDASSEGVNGIAALNQRLSKVQGTLARTLVTLRAYKISELLAQGPHKATLKLHAQYANALHEEEAILSKHFDQMSSPALRYLAQDAGDIWAKWVYVSKLVYDGLVTLDQDIHDELDEFLKRMHDLNARHDALLVKLNDISDTLEKNMGMSLAGLRDFYKREISERQAKHRKWYADIEWLEYMQAVKKQDELSAKFKLEEQMLKDNLRDLEQGVLWQWR